jgi:hypothetical protein
VTHFCKGSPGCQVRLPDDVEDCGRHGSPTEKDLRATVRLVVEMRLCGLDAKVTPDGGIVIRGATD